MPSQKPRTIFLLRLLQLNIYNLMVEQLGEFGVKPIQYMVLSLVNNRGSWSTAELARRFHIAPQSMNEVVASLRKKKLVERRKSLEHGRILHIRLTAGGARLLEKCDKAADRVERVAFQEFTPDKLSLFRDQLSQALATFSAREDRPRSRSTSPSDNGAGMIDQRGAA